MKKNLLACSMLPVMALLLSGTGLAAPAAASGSENQVPVTEQSLQELRTQLEEQLKASQELQARLNAQLENLNKRMKKMEKRTWQPPIDLHGYTRLRYDRSHYKDLKCSDRNSVWLNLFTKYRINDRWNIRSEHEFEHNLSDNNGACDGDGKSYSRPILQLYAEGRIGEVDVKIGRFYLQSPYKFTYDEKVNGWQASWGAPTKWGGRKATFTLNSGNSYSHLNYGDSELGKEWDTGSSQFRALTLMSVIPVGKNTNITNHLGKMTLRETGKARRIASYGFDTKLNRDFSLEAAFAKSDANTLNKSHVIQLKYKEAKADIPGSYEIYVKKYLQRQHTGFTNQFNDDIDKDEQHFRVRGVDHWDLTHRYGEFNGLRVGVDFVPMRNTKMLLNYTFGKLAAMDPGTNKLTGFKRDYSLLRAEWQFYF